MKYTISYKKQALKFIEKQPKPQRERIFEAIHKLPEQGDIKPLRANSDLLRLRVGDYRIVYSVDNGQLVVYVIDADNRGQIYNKY